MRLLLDEMVGPSVATALRQQQVDVESEAARTDLRATTDAALLELAAQQGLVLVTRNISDFLRLVRQWQSEGREHPGLVLVTESSFPQNRNLVGRLVQALTRDAAAGDLPGPDRASWLAPPEPLD